MSGGFNESNWIFDNMALDYDNLTIFEQNVYHQQGGTNYQPLNFKTGSSFELHEPLNFGTVAHTTLNDPSFSVFICANWIPSFGCSLC